MISDSCVLIFLLAIATSHAYVKQIATPVVYTNNNGGGVDELQAPANEDASKLFDAGSPVRSAWWVPYDNIGDLSAIHRIDVHPSGNNVNLVVHGHPNQRNGRVRIKIFGDVLY